jgi:hypothetical protein
MNNLKIGALAASAMAIAAVGPALNSQLVAGALAQRSRPPLPDRASIEEESEFYSDFGGLKVGVRFNGEVRKNDVAEYCVSEGWIMVVGRINGVLARKNGRLRTARLEGVVEPFYL